MGETGLAIAAETCAVFYWTGVLILLFKNGHRIDARLAAIGAIVVWPALFFMAFLQLIFVIPLFTVFFIDGFTLPKSLSRKSIWTALGLTFAVLAIIQVWLMLGTEAARN